MNVVSILVGNKSDLKDSSREVSVDEGKSLAEAEGLFFMETSALDSSNVSAAFQTVVKQIYNIFTRKIMESKRDDPSWNTVALEMDVVEDTQAKTRGCCSS